MNPVNYDLYRERARQLRAAEFSRQLNRVLRLLAKWRRLGNSHDGSGLRGPGRTQTC